MIESLLLMHKAWVPPLGMVIHTSTPSTQEMEAGVPDVQCYSWLLEEYEVSLRHMRPYLKDKIISNQNRDIGERIKRENKSMV